METRAVVIIWSAMLKGSPFRNGSDTRAPLTLTNRSKKPGASFGIPVIVTVKPSMKYALVLAWSTSAEAGKDAFVTCA